MANWDLSHGSQTEISHGRQTICVSLFFRTDQTYWPLASPRSARKTSTISGHKRVQSGQLVWSPALTCKADLETPQIHVSCLVRPNGTRILVEGRRGEWLTPSLKNRSGVADSMHETTVARHQGSSEPTPGKRLVC